MRYWWVSQNQTFKDEVDGGFLWSPKKNKDGTKNHFYDNMTRIAKGDVVFSYCGTKIKALGIAQGPATTFAKPDFGTAGSNWENEGWRVPVQFRRLATQIRPKEHIVDIRPHLPSKYSPLKPGGNGNQMYLAEISESLANLLGRLIGKEYVIDSQAEVGELDILDVVEASFNEATAGRMDIGDTVKDQIVQIRRGQTQFKMNVARNERKCRITGVDQIQHLRASHMKPWKDCTDQERLNGCNGLLLAPHIDHLFDQGFISFANNGDVLVSPALDRAILSMWGVDQVRNVGPFHPDQQVFLAYHRDHIYKK